MFLVFVDALTASLQSSTLYFLDEPKEVGPSGHGAVGKSMALVLN